MYCVHFGSYVAVIMQHATYRPLVLPCRVEYASLAISCGLEVYVCIVREMYQSGFFPMTWNVAETHELSALI